MKKILFVILLLTFGSLITYFFYFSKKENKVDSLNTSSVISPSPSPETYLYKKTTYFVITAGIKNKTDNINIEELKTIPQIYALNSDKDLLLQQDSLKSINFIYLDTQKEINQKLNTSLDLAITNLNNLTFKLKTLSIDNQFIFDRSTNLDLYPLKITQEIKSIEKHSDESNFSSQKLTKLGHTGSMIPARGIQYWIENKFNGDYTLPFQSTKPLFDTFDFLSSTFESSVLGNGVTCDHCMSFVGPEKFLEGVKYSGIDIYSMAANHILDGGTDGIQNTMNKLDEVGIKHTGASPKNNDDAAKPVIVDVNGIKIAYLAFNDTPGREQWAMENKPGAASISDWQLDEEGNTVRYEPNEERIKYFLDRAKAQNPDLVIVLMHWGSQEYVDAALPYQRKLAELLTQNGADIILGDHVHWVQEVEFMGDKPIFYGVGNFIFDQMWSIETRQGITIELNFIDKKLVNFRLHPHQLNLHEKGQVELLKPTDPGYQQTLDRIMNVSNFGNKE